MDGWQFLTNFDRKCYFELKSTIFYSPQRKRLLQQQLLTKLQSISCYYYSFLSSTEQTKLLNRYNGVNRPFQLIFSAFIAVDVIKIDSVL